MTTKIDTTLPRHVLLNLLPEERTRADLERERERFSAMPDTWRAEGRTAADVLATIDTLIATLDETHTETMGAAFEVLRRTHAPKRHGAN